MQRRFGGLTLKLRLTKIRNFRGLRPPAPARDGEVRVVSAICFLSSSGQFLRPRGIGSLCFFSTRFIVEKRKLFHCWPLITVRRLPTYSDALNNSVSPEPFHVGIVFLIQRSLLRPYGWMGGSSLEITTFKATEPLKCKPLLLVNRAIYHKPDKNQIWKKFKQFENQYSDIY